MQLKLATFLKDLKIKFVWIITNQWQASWNETKKQEKLVMPRYFCIDILCFIYLQLNIWNPEDRWIDGRRISKDVKQ